ncbi:MAG: isopentenyl-diphosphate delta-isomerase [bacterium]|nr:isopentenyl-diphosphate delta-isomerase [bacterium]
METNQTSSRKQDHIELAFLSQTACIDSRFYYEPLLSAHPEATVIPQKTIANKALQLPLWVSSMTGGTLQAGVINRNLAMACNEFGMGMGLGSCRIILKDATYFEDFNVRQYLGNELPFFANLGIAQIEELLALNQIPLLVDLIKRLDADGLIVHVNPLQEWLQPEGDRIKFAPIDTIKRLIDKIDCKIIVKEVGQGFGPKSFVELLQLPIEAIEFGAHGGTNFATLELLRQPDYIKELLTPITKIGHTAIEMVDFANLAVNQLGDKALCRNLIISGGVKDFLDGYYLIQKANTNAVYAQASAFLKHATGDYETLRNYCELQKKGLQTCYSYLSIKS